MRAQPKGKRTYEHNGDRVQRTTAGNHRYWCGVGRTRGRINRCKLERDCKQLLRPSRTEDKRSLSSDGSLDITASVACALYELGASIKSPETSRVTDSKSRTTHEQTQPPTTSLTCKLVSWIATAFGHGCYARIKGRQRSHCKKLKTERGCCQRTQCNDDVLLRFFIERLDGKNRCRFANKRRLVKKTIRKYQQKHGGVGCLCSQTNSLVVRLHTMPRSSMAKWRSRTNTCRWRALRR